MKRATNILYITDGALNNMKVLGQVMKFANLYQASLTLLDVIDFLPASKRMLTTAVPTGDLRKSVVLNRLAELKTLASQLESSADDLRTRVLFGNPAREIAREAVAGGYDLVVKNPEKAGTDKYLVRHCNCPVWLLKTNDYDSSGQILSSHAPRFTARDNKQPLAPGFVSGTDSFAGWFSWAQEFLRLKSDPKRRFSA